VTKRSPHFSAYSAQRSKARHRGIPFELSFEEWLKVWEDSGRLPERGRRRGQYVMARNGDQGAYAVGNILIITADKNIQERISNNRTSSFRERVVFLAPRGFTAAVEQAAAADFTKPSDWLRRALIRPLRDADVPLKSPVSTMISAPEEVQF
jgi:hypothetical protein